MGRDGFDMVEAARNRLIVVMQVHDKWYCHE